MQVQMAHNVDANRPDAHTRHLACGFVLLSMIATYEASAARQRQVTASKPSTAAASKSADTIPASRIFACSRPISAICAAKAARWPRRSPGPTGGRDSTCCDKSLLQAHPVVATQVAPSRMAHARGAPLGGRSLLVYQGGSLPGEIARDRHPQHRDRQQDRRYDTGLTHLRLQASHLDQLRGRRRPAGCGDLLA